jgi:hypothetical protein
MPGRSEIMETFVALLVVMLAAPPAASKDTEARGDFRLAPAYLHGEAMRDKRSARHAAVSECSDKATAGSSAGTAPADRRPDEERHARFVSHQQKMKNCSKEASGRKLKGYERIDFMASCLGM